MKDSQELKQYFKYKISYEADLLNMVKNDQGGEGLLQEAKWWGQESLRHWKKRNQVESCFSSK